MKINVTFNAQKFMELEVPQLDSYNMGKCFLPNLKFNRTYYKLIGAKQLQAFRILAIALKSGITSKTISYLVQLPNKETKWVYEYITQSDVIFTDKTDFLEYMQGNISLNINKTCQWHNAVKYVETLTEYNVKTNQIYHSWGVDEHTQAPKLTSSKIKYFLILEDSVEICLEHYSEKYFNTKEECLAYQLNGFIIDDFAEDVQEISIKVLPNKAKTKILHVIELENE